MTALPGQPANAAEVNGNPPSPSPPPNNAARSVDKLKVLAIFVVLLVLCGVGAYLITANVKEDKIDESNTPMSHNQKAVIAPKLVCVMRSTPAYDQDSLVGYSACDYLVYYAHPDSFNPPRAGGHQRSQDYHRIRG
ncbi:hypothetical protein MTO96_016034 [Rhipicephalus appendiculatus]